ncbi:hypothetical protein, partial [Okeania hirsuta]|uniref:hypothetical protein n=1 Tax=Okeania hirsuta TaxID=1458930 RepID=UPI0019617AA5
MERCPWVTEAARIIGRRKIWVNKFSASSYSPTEDKRIFWGSMAYTFIKYGEKQQLLMRITDITESKEFEQ